jgi:hypothetical protein
MTQKLEGKELVSFEELLMANSVIVDTLAQLLIEKGVFNKEESAKGRMSSAGQ